ncbi:helix-turn-helix transcriptional regulator [Serinicoccus sp. CNJ-927]|uniref:helix-turn-helix transcriptional regulator n=1 Tax=Serinicoccus sp. CNJ-927 TaxID=1904970 RepID=UPI0022A91BEB|nr:helix-turn-helix transcriptional regulator [Serinicoccus sp. CNJ-927]
MPSDISCFDPAVLRAAREQAGMTQRAVALALGVAGGERVSAWEAGRGTPRDTQLAALAEIVGVSVDELVPGERA